MTDNRSVREAVLAVMQRGAHQTLTDAEFNSLALRVFAHQFENNEPYRRYCERRDRTPANTEHWHDIPPVPTAAFKEVALFTDDIDRAALTFRTSGTTRGAERRGLHYIRDAALYEASLLAGFREFMLPGIDRMLMVSLIAPTEEVPDSSLSFMASSVMRTVGAPGSTFVASAQEGLDIQQLDDVLSSTDQPVCILGTSLAYVHWFESTAGSLFRRARKFQLPEGSRLMDTGGFKGETRQVTPAELRAQYEDRLGIPADHCINEYGMTELCSQYYDADLRDGASVERIKKGPPWLRARIVDPETLAPVLRGTTGIVQHFDLANVDSVAAVLTEDLAHEETDGFVLRGRAPGATPRGCSIAMDILLNDK